MHDKYINFIYALVVGKTSTGKGAFDIWDCEEGVKYFVDIVMPCFMPDKMIFNGGEGYHPFAYMKKGKIYE